MIWFYDSIGNTPSPSNYLLPRRSHDRGAKDVAKAVITGASQGSFVDTLIFERYAGTTMVSHLENAQ